MATVAAYLAKQPSAVRVVLAPMRAALRAALPGSEEVISYGIPAYRLHGRVVVFFAGWKTHVSIYPVTAPVVAELGDALNRYERSKGTLRFPLDRPVPVRLVTRIAKILSKQAAARAKAAAKPKRARTKTRNLERKSSP